jgi:hypothetical protein
MRAAEVGLRANRNEQKGHAMKMLSLNKVAPLLAVLTIGSVSIASGALANGGGGIGGEYINGEALTTGGDFSCSDADDPACLSNDHVNQLPSVRHPNRIAHNHKGT